MNRAARIFVYLLQAASIIFVIRTILENSTELTGLAIPLGSLFFLIPASLVVLSLTSFALIFAYHKLLSGLSDLSPSWQDVAFLHGRTVLAKYLPGNIFQFVGRQLVGKELGWSQISIATATLFEVVLLVSISSFASLIFGSIASAVYIAWLPKDLVTFFLLVGIFGPIIFILGVWKVKLSILEKFGLPKRLNFDILKLFPAGVFYLSYILLSGGVFVFLRTAIFGSIDLQTSVAYIAAFSLSYLIGYITPGAPGGIGVREALLVLLLSSYSSPTIVAATALAHRISWIAAELAFVYFVVPVIKKRQ